MLVAFTPLCYNKKLLPKEKYRNNKFFSKYFMTIFAFWICLFRIHMCDVKYYEYFNIEIKSLDGRFLLHTHVTSKIAFVSALQS